MRKNARITSLENEVARLGRLIDQLMETITAPTTQPMVKPAPLPTKVDWRGSSRRRVEAKNARRKWSKAEIELLAKLLNQGATRAEIATVMGRSLQGIHAACNKYIVENA